MNVYEIIVFCDEKRDKDDEVVEPAEIVVGPETIIARDDDQAQLLASRKVPESHLEKLDRLTVAVRPF